MHYYHNYTKSFYSDEIVFVIIIIIEGLFRDITWTPL